MKISHFILPLKIDSTYESGARRGWQIFSSAAAAQMFVLLGLVENFLLLDLLTFI